MDQLAIPYPVTDANDDPVSGALLYVYRTGTTTLSTDIYQDDDASAAHVNPVVCDSAGRPPQVFFNGGYAVRVRATTPSGATIFDHDPVPRVSSSTSAASSIGFVPLSTNSATNVQKAIENLQAKADQTSLATGLMAGGSVGEPGLRFADDTNTGFYRIADDIMGLSVGGTERLRFTNTKTQITGPLYFNVDDYISYSTGQGLQIFENGVFSARIGPVNYFASNVEMNGALAVAGVLTTGGERIVSQRSDYGIGAIAFARKSAGGTETLYGTTISGSSLQVCNAAGTNNNAGIAVGTWRCLGYSAAFGGASENTATLWTRIA